MGKQSHSNRTKSTPASQDVVDIMHVIPEAEGGIDHVYNCAFVPKVLLAEFDKLPPWHRREVVAEFLGDRTVALATAACVAATSQLSSSMPMQRTKSVLKRLLWQERRKRRNGIKKRGRGRPRWLQRVSRRLLSV